jgi:phosphate transport system substrate-binding protein
LNFKAGRYNVLIGIIIEKEENMKQRPVAISLLILVLLGIVLSACGEEVSRPVLVSPLPQPAATSTPVPGAALLPVNRDEFGRTNVTSRLVGSGSTFADPVYRNWIPNYNKTAPNVKIEYQGIGSGGGRNAFLGTPVAPSGNITPIVPNDFAGSDSPFRGQELLNARNRGEILHIPTAIGAVVVAYNVKEMSRLKISGPTLADIYLGKITRWNDRTIQAENPDVRMPDREIKVVIRTKNAAGSGTSEIFTRYLSVVSDEFRDKVGPGSSPKWTLKTVSEGGKTLEGTGNDGIAAAVRDNEGAIGYVDQGAADEQKLTYASIRNKTGRFIYPELSNVSAAALGSYIPDDFRTFIVNGEGDNTYPIAGLTWIITWRNLSQMTSPSREKAEALVSFLWWGIHDGQRNLPKGYAPLPDSLIPRLERLFVTEQTKPEEKVFIFDGKTVLPQLSRP